MLELRDVVTYYGPIPALKGISLTVRQGEIVCLLGGNASGKSTTMKTILGVVRPHRGSVSFEDAGSTACRPRRSSGAASRWCRRRAACSAHDRAREPGDGRVHAARRRAAELEADRERVFALFPRLAERAQQLAGTMSGGEQQMLAIGRADGAAAPPAHGRAVDGLSPAFVDQVFDIIQTINRQGVTILVVEQNAVVALGIANRGYVLQNGRMVAADTAATLLAADHIRRAYLGEI